MSDCGGDKQEQRHVDTCETADSASDEDNQGTVEGGFPPPSRRGILVGSDAHLTHDDDDVGGVRSTCSSISPTSSNVVRGERQVLQDDFDHPLLHRRSYDFDDNNEDDYDDESYDSDDDLYPYDDDDSRDQYQDRNNRYQSMVEEVEQRALIYQDYDLVEREIDAYLEEPMRQLMREMEEEMKQLYLDELAEERRLYDDEAECRSRRRYETDNDDDNPAVHPPSRHPSGVQLRHVEMNAASSASSYASVQATIQHAIINYHKWALES